jgi:hypothetical protein
MKQLQAYVDSKNKWNAIFGSKQYDLSNAADRQQLAECIDSELSPENLTCDGELSASQVRARYRSLITVANELRAFDPNVTFQEV